MKQVFEVDGVFARLELNEQGEPELILLPITESPQLIWITGWEALGTLRNALAEVLIDRPPDTRPVDQDDDGIT